MRRGLAGGEHGGGGKRVGQQPDHSGPHSKPCFDFPSRRRVFKTGTSYLHLQNPSHSFIGNRLEESKNWMQGDQLRVPCRDPDESMR